MQYVAPRSPMIGRTEIIFRDVDPVNDTLVYAIAGSDGNAYWRNIYGRIYRSTDGGTSWSIIRLDTTLCYHRAQFLDERTGYMMAGAGSTSDRLLRTTDGGLTWNDLYRIRERMPDNPLGELHYLDNFHFIDSLVGVIVVDDRLSASEYAAIRRTTDGGRSWTTVVDNSGASWLPSRYRDGVNFDSAQVSAMSFLREGKGWAVTTLGEVWHHPCVRDGVTIDTSGPTTIREGDSLVLSLPTLAGADGYRWSTGERTRTIVVRSSGRYEGRIVFSDGCLGIASLSVVALPNVAAVGTVTAGCSDCRSLVRDENVEKLLVTCQERLTSFDTTARGLLSVASKMNEGVVSSAIDSRGAIYATVSRSSLESVLVRWAANGVVKDLRVINNISLADRPQVAIDDRDNVYFADARHSESYQAHSLHVEKLDGEGAVIWTRDYGSKPGTANVPFRMAFDAAGGLYVASRVVEDVGDILLQKFSADGERLWSRVYAREPRSIERIDAMLVDARGSTFISGVSQSTLSADSVRTLIAYDADGAMLFEKSFELLGESGAMLASDALGGLYFGRDFPRNLANAAAHPLLRLGPDGSERWGRIFGGDSTDFVELAAISRLAAIASDRFGSVYIAGRTSTGMRVERFDGDGRKRWSIGQTKGQAGLEPRGIAVTRDGSVIVMSKDAISDNAICELTRLSQLIAPQTLSSPDTRDHRAHAGAIASLALFPNPSSGAVTMAFELERAADVTIGLYDDNGSLVATTTLGRIGYGVHRTIIGADDLASGVYLVVMRAGNDVITAQLTIVR